MYRNSQKQDSSYLYFQAHIGQLVAVQHKRGAQGGLVFTRGLNLHLNLGDTGEDMPEERLQSAGGLGGAVPASRHLSQDPPPHP